MQNWELFGQRVPAVIAQTLNEPHISQNIAQELKGEPKLGRQRGGEQAHAIGTGCGAGLERAVSDKKRQ